MVLFLHNRYRTTGGEERTVEDLLRQTSGLVYGDKGNTAVHKLWRENGVDVAGLARDGTLKEFVSEVARLPLAHQPGEVWEYGHNYDVLGRVIEVVSGEPLDRFLANRLFKPLGMVDTGFWVPPEKRDRLVDPPAGAAILPDRDVTRPTMLFSGGGGLVSTATDYLRFCQMLLNGGELDGVRILSTASVRRMTTNALPPGIRSTNRRSAARLRPVSCPQSRDGADRPRDRAERQR